MASYRAELWLGLCGRLYWHCKVLTDHADATIGPPGGRNTPFLEGAQLVGTTAVPGDFIYLRRRQAKVHGEISLETSWCSPAFHATELMIGKLKTVMLLNSALVNPSLKWCD